MHITDPLVAPGRCREPLPLLRPGPRRRRPASYALTAEVHPVLVLVDPANVTVTAPPRSVRVLTDAELPGLAPPWAGC